MIKNIKSGYKKTKVGMIPCDWAYDRIDTFLKRVRKKVDVIATEKYHQIGIRSHCKGIFHKKFVTGEELGNKSVFWLEEDCFIVNIVFAWEQAVAKTSENEKGMIASHRFPMYKPKDNKVNIDYILNYFKSKRGKHLLGLASPGGAGRNKTLGQKEFAELKIPVPPLPEQNKIVKILQTWDEAIAKTEELIKLKEKSKKGLMQQLLSGKKRLKGFSGEWKEVRLGDIGEIVRGVSYKPEDLSDKDNKNTVRLLRSSNIKQNTLDIDVELRYVHKSKVSNYQRLNYNDLAICMANGSKKLVGKNGVFQLDDEFNYTVGAFCAIYKFKKDVVKEYFKYIFQSNKYEYFIQNSLAGTNINNLKNENIKYMKFLVPILEHEQKAIASILTTADEEITILNKQLESMKQQKLGLMQKLLTGEVRVSV